MRPDGLVHSGGSAILAGSDAPSLQVPDGFDLFSAQFSRDGDDLVIAAEGGSPLTVIDYFTVESPPALEMPNGAMLRGDVVELLAGPRAPGQYAQADAPEAGESIGRVETLSGSSTATRVSGETVELAQGDPVFQGDVIQTAGDSTLGIRLEDGTLASMLAQSRLVLNEFVYETGGSDNWMLVDLVEGAFAFLTGAIAPSGGMEITTPVAVMAIRGTLPVAIISGLDGSGQFYAGSEQDYDLLRLTREFLAVVSSEVGYSVSSPDAPLETIELDPEALETIQGLLDVLNDAAAEFGLQGIQHGSVFHAFDSSFGSIDGGNLSTTLIEFLVLLQEALAEDSVESVQVSETFVAANSEPIAFPTDTLLDEQGLSEPAVVGTGEVVVDFGLDLPIDLVGAFSFTTDGLDGQLETTGGTPVTFSIAENGDLVGSAGGAEVIRIAIIDASGAGSEVTYTYEVTLSQSLMHTGEGTQSAFLSGVGFMVEDSNGDSVEGSFDVEVIDDVPVAADDDSGVVVGAVDLNIAFVLDYSTSLSPAELHAQIEAVKSAALEFFNRASGDVRMTVVAFGLTATALTGPDGVTFDNYDDFAAALDATDVLNGGTRPVNGNWTNYTAAIEETMASYSLVEGAVNQVFFISDGMPNRDTGTDHALESDTREDWNTFVASNDVTVQTIGVGTGADVDSLQDVDEADGNDDVIVVEEFQGLVDSLLDLINRVELSGNVLDNDAFGADGPGHVASLEVGDSTYAYDGSSVTIPDGAEGDADGSVLTVETGLGAMLTFDFATGEFSYVTTTSGTGIESFGYTIADGDGDTASATLTVTVEDEGFGQFSASAFTTGSEDQMMQMLASDLEGSQGQVHTITDLSIDEVIIDYQEGDVIDLTRLGFELATGQFNADVAGAYVAYDQAGGVLSVDLDGAGREAEFEVAAEFVTPPPSVLVRLSDGDSTADIVIA